MSEGGKRSGAGTTKPHVRRLPTFLFNVGAVERELALRPHLKAVLSDPSAEGEESSYFVGWRKSPLQIYRVLANPHYGHLAAMLDTLDRCLGQGFEQPRLIRTRGRVEFDTALSELLTAEHFLLRGFSVRGLDTAKGSEPVPDVLVEGSGLRAAVEVYTPFEWLGLDDLHQDVVDAMKNLDEPFEFVWDWEVEQIHEFDATQPEPRLLFLQPGSLADALDADNKAAALVHPLVERVVSAMRAGEQEPLIAESEHEEMNVRLRLSIQSYAWRNDAPARSGTNSGPNLSAYRPEMIFESVVKRAKRKATKRQAGFDGDALEMLVVDLARAKIGSELVHDVYRRIFDETLDRELDETMPYDLIALCEGRGFGKGVTTHFVIRQNTRVSDAELKRLFDVEL